MIFRFFRPDPSRVLVDTLLTRVAVAARAPWLYRDMGVPDTIEGRFESYALHMVLTLRHMRTLPEPADDAAQELVDAYFKSLDHMLREMGVGDLGVPKRMKKLGEAFYGRARTYDPLLDAKDSDGLALALGRNVVGTPAPAHPLAAYALEAQARLAAQDLDALFAAGPDFPAAPQTP